jgi:hypothetical protein
MFVFSESRAKEVYSNWVTRDLWTAPARPRFINITDQKSFGSFATSKVSGPVPKLIINQTLTMLQYTMATACRYENLWVPQEYRFQEYSVDWESSPLGTEVVVCMPESICKHSLNTNMVSTICNNLVNNRKVVKNQMKICNIELINNPGNSDIQDKAKVKNLLQWALKIAANSLYGSLAFREYNTYSLDVACQLL